MAGSVAGHGVVVRGVLEDEIPLADLVVVLWDIAPWTRRELHLHPLLADTTIPDLVATAVDDHATITGQSPAENA